MPRLTAKNERPHLLHRSTISLPIELMSIRQAYLPHRQIFHNQGKLSVGLKFLGYGTLAVGVPMQAILRFLSHSSFCCVGAVG
jgi:hypothetical protein